MLGVFCTELHITVTMAGAARLHCQESCQHLPKIGGSVVASNDRSPHFVPGAQVGVFVTRCESSCRSEQKPTLKSVTIGRSDGFLLFKKWRIRVQPLHRFDFWLCAYARTCGGGRVQ